MAIIDMCGFDTCSTRVDFESLLNNPLTATGTVTINQGQGLLGGNSMSTSGGGYVTPADVSGSVGYFCIHRGSVKSTKVLAVSRYNDSATYSDNLVVSINSDGAVIVTNAYSASTQTAFPAGTIQPDKWFYISISWNCVDSGFVGIRVNNSTWSWSSDFNIGFNKYVHFLLGATGIEFDDFVRASDISHYLTPPQCIHYLPPVSDRATQDFVALNAGSGFEEVNELIPDGDDSYITGSIIGDASEFEVSDSLPVEMIGVTGVKLHGFAKRDGEGGTNGIKFSMHTASGTTVSSFIPALSEVSYSTNTSPIVVTNPDDTQPWDISDLVGLYVRVEIE